jgi:hypothetical protein
MFFPCNAENNNENADQLYNTREANDTFPKGTHTAYNLTSATR